MSSWHGTVEKRGNDASSGRVSSLLHPTSCALPAHLVPFRHCVHEVYTLGCAGPPQQLRSPQQTAMLKTSRGSSVMVSPTPTAQTYRARLAKAQRGRLPGGQKQRHVPHKRRSREAWPLPMPPRGVLPSSSSRRALGAPGMAPALLRPGGLLDTAAAECTPLHFDGLHAQQTWALVHHRMEGMAEQPTAIASHQSNGDSGRAESAPCTSSQGYIGPVALSMIHRWKRRALGHPVLQRIPVAPLRRTSQDLVKRHLREAPVRVSVPPRAATSSTSAGMSLPPERAEATSQATAPSEAEESTSPRAGHKSQPPKAEPTPPVSDAPSRGSKASRAVLDLLQGGAGIRPEVGVGPSQSLGSFGSLQQWSSEEASWGSEAVGLPLTSPSKGPPIASMPRSGAPSAPSDAPSTMPHLSQVSARSAHVLQGALAALQSDGSRLPRGHIDRGRGAPDHEAQQAAAEGQSARRPIPASRTAHPVAGTGVHGVHEGTSAGARGVRELSSSSLSHFSSSGSL